jgi:hypothetical protein
MQDFDYVIIGDKGVPVLSQPLNTLREETLVWILEVGGRLSTLFLARRPEAITATATEPLNNFRRRL